jgi:hypothetical protein
MAAPPEYSGLGCRQIASGWLPEASENGMPVVQPQ